MTKYARRRKNKRSHWFIWLILFVFAALVTFLVVQQLGKPATSSVENQSNATANQEQPKSVNQPENSGESKEADEETKSNADNGTGAEQATENPKQTIQNEGTNPNTLSGITGALTRADTTDDKLIIRVNIDQYLTSGSCTLTLTSGENKYSDVANIIAEASTSSCAGFDVPTSKLGSGKWNISIQISSGDKQGIINGEVSL